MKEGNIFALRAAAAPSGPEGDDLLRLLNELQKCVRCGQCRASCPVFRESGSETDVARGKLALLVHYLAPDTTPDRELYGRLTRCVNCGRCRLECPSGADTGYALLEGRVRLARRVGMPPVKAFAVRGLFGHPGLLRTAAAFLRLVQPLLFRPREADPRYVRSLWRLPPFGQWMLLPRLRGGLAAEAGGGQPAPGRVAASGTLVVYPGCLVELGYPELLADVETVYTRLGWRVVIPRGLVCCGAPAAYAGDLETARRLAAINLRAVLPYLRGAEGEGEVRVGFLCPSCAVAFKQDYPEYLFGKLSGGAAALAASGMTPGDLQLASSRTEDAAALAWRLGIAEHLKGETVASVTYHDPCHLRRLLGVVKEPRAALRAMSGHGYREAPDPDSCCGFGGTFAIEHPEAGSALLARRVEGLVSTGAELVATACPGCMAWLANGLDRAGSAQRPVHLIELLARGLR